MAHAWWRDEDYALFDRLQREKAALEGERDAWMETAREFSNGLEFYRGIVQQTGAHFGPAAYTSDDGSVQDSVLALKVPELAEQAEATTRRLEKELAVAEQEREAWMKEWARKGDRADRAKAEARRLEAERDMLRGVGCGEAKEGEPASGPCGVCVKCLKAEARRLREALEEVRERINDPDVERCLLYDIIDAALAATPEGPS